MNSGSLNFDISGVINDPDQMRPRYPRASLLRRGQPEHRSHLESRHDADVGKRVVLNVVENHVVTLIALSEIFLRVIDHLIRAE